MSQEAFDKAAVEVKAFKKRPPDTDLLELYAFFKQATVGDNNTSQPWAVQFEARAKWDAWDKKKGMTKEAARQAYIDAAEKLKPDYA